MIYENVNKKRFIPQQTYVYMGVTDILKFYFAHIVKVCFFSRNSHYVYISLYINKTLTTLGNEKEQQQIKFNKKLLAELIFSSVQKVRLHHCSYKSKQILANV